jgi:peptide/nickel transport system permease protein
MIPVLLVGIWLGILSAVHQDKFIDHTTRVFALVGWSFPTFVFGLLMLMYFLRKIAMVPPRAGL